MLGEAEGKDTLKGGWRKTAWQFLKNFNMALPHNPAILLLNMHPKEPRAGTHIGVCAAMFTAASPTNAKRWRHPTC